MRFLAFILVSVAIALADTVALDIVCLNIKDVGVVKLSDINKPSVKLDTENGKYTIPEGYPTDVFDDMSAVIASKEQPLLYQFKLKEFNPELSPKNIANAMATCPTVTKEQALNVMKVQKAPYVIYTDMTTNTEVWAHISSKDSAKIVRSGGKLNPGVYVSDRPLILFEAATYSYTCGSGTFDWFTALREIETTLRDYQSATDWTNNGYVNDVRLQIASMSIPPLPSCVSIERMPNYIRDAKRMLDQYPCKVRVDEKIIQLKRCGI